MKKMDLLDALGGLDEKYVREADARADALKSKNITPIEMLTNAEEEPQNKGIRRPQWLRVMTGVAAAAVFALTVGTVGKVIMNARRGPGMTPGSSVAGTGAVSTSEQNMFGGNGELRMLTNYAFEDDDAIYLKDQMIDKKTGTVSPFILSYGEGLLFSDGAGICRIDSNHVIHRVNSDGTEETLLDLNTLLENVTVRFDPEMDVFYKVGENRWFLSFGATENLPDRIGQRVACWIDIPTPGEIGHVTFYNGSDALTLQENPFRFETSVSLTRTDKPDLYLFKGRTPSDGLVFDTVALFSNEGDGSLSTFFGNVSTLELYNVAYSGGYYYYTEMVNTPDDSHVHINLSRKPVDNTLQEGELLWDDCGFRQFSMKGGRIYTVDYSQNEAGDVISVKPDGSDRKELAAGCGTALYDLCFVDRAAGTQYFIYTEDSVTFCDLNDHVQIYPISHPETTTDGGSKEQTTQTKAEQVEGDEVLLHYNTLFTDLSPWFSKDSSFAGNIDYTDDQTKLQGAAFAELIGATKSGCLLQVYLPEKNARESVKTTGEYMMVRYADENMNLLSDAKIMKAKSAPQTTITKEKQMMAISWDKDFGMLDDGGFYGMAVQVEEPSTGNTDWFQISLSPSLLSGKTVEAEVIGEDDDRLYLKVKTGDLAADGQTVAFIDQMKIPAPDDANILYGPLFPEPENKDLSIPYEYAVEIDSLSPGVVQFYYPDYYEKVGEDETLITVSWTNGYWEFKPAKGGAYQLLTEVFYDNGKADDEGMNARLLKQYYDNVKEEKAGSELSSENVTIRFKMNG